MRTPRKDQGKVGILSLLIFAAIGYAVWRWGLPMFESSLHKESKEDAAKEAEQKGQSVPIAPPSAPTPATNASSTPTTIAPSTSASQPAPQQGGTAATSPAPDAREAAARTMLNLAKNFEANHMNETAQAKYEELIQVYPGTKAAEEAKPLLEALKRK